MRRQFLIFVTSLPFSVAMVSTTSYAAVSGKSSSSSSSSSHAASRPASQTAKTPKVEAGHGVYDLTPLHLFTGKVIQFLLSPGGAVIGFILEGGYQVFVTPDEGYAFAGVIKPGDVVQVRGLKGGNIPVIRAFEVIGPNGRSVRDTFITMPQYSPEIIAGPDLILHGEIWMPLYTMDGRIAGVILKNHAVIHLSPGEAVRVANMLKPGKTLYAMGAGCNGIMGTAISARELGPTLDTMIPIVVGNAPPPGPPAGSNAYDVIGPPTTY